jgi:hypothetical protein
MTADSLNPMIVPRRPLSLWDKTLALGALFAAGAIFLTLGWMTLEPDDPHGAVSLVSYGGSGMVWLQAAGLAAVTATIATIVIGRRLPDVGAFAVGVGLTAVSLRGGTSEYVLIRRADQISDFQRVLALQFAGESVAWFAVIFVGVIVSSLIMRWVFEVPRVAADEAVSNPDLGAWALAGLDIPYLRDSALTSPLGVFTPVRQGLAHSAMAAAGALIIMAVLSAGLSSRAIEHGQTCFLVALAVVLGTWIAFRLFPVQTPLWCIFAVLLFALAANLWAAFAPPSPNLPAHLPKSNFLRVLPVQYIAVGTAASLAMFWYLQAGFVRPEKTEAGHASVKGKAGTKK